MRYTVLYSVWEVEGASERAEINGGVDGYVCSDHNTTDTVFDVMLNETTGNGTRPRQTCETLVIPDCEDRTIYCTFPPKSILNGVKRTVANPNPDGYENPSSKHHDLVK